MHNSLKQYFLNDQYMMLYNHAYIVWVKDLIEI